MREKATRVEGIEGWLPSVEPSWLDIGFSLMPLLPERVDERSYLATYNPVYHFKVEPMIGNRCLGLAEEYSHASLQLSPIGSHLFLDAVYGKKGSCISPKLRGLVEGSFIAEEYFNHFTRESMYAARSALGRLGFPVSPSALELFDRFTYLPKARVHAEYPTMWESILCAKRIEKIVRKLNVCDQEPYPKLSRFKLNRLEFLAMNVIEMVLRSNPINPFRSLSLLEDAQYQSFFEADTLLRSQGMGASPRQVHARLLVFIFYRLIPILGTASALRMSPPRVIAPFLTTLISQLDFYQWPLLSLEYELDPSRGEEVEMWWEGPSGEMIKLAHEVIHRLVKLRNLCRLKIWERSSVEFIYSDFRNTGMEATLDNKEARWILSDYYGAIITQLLKAFREGVMKPTNSACPACKKLQEEISEDYSRVPWFGTISRLIFTDKGIEKVAKYFSEAFDIYPVWARRCLIPNVKRLAHAWRTEISGI